MEFFETHMHLNDTKFDEDREETIKKIWESNVTKCIEIGCDINSSKKAIEIANNHHFIYASVGLHPEEIPDSKVKINNELKEIEKMVLSNNKIVAIGEIGLDYYWNKENKELQKYAFEKQIEIANVLQLPISIHTRDAIDDMISIIRTKSIEKLGVLHCCPFNVELVNHAIKKDIYIGFGGTSTFKNSKNVKKILEIVPMNKILIETDSPYLAPEPFRGTRNDSSNLKYIVQKIAEIKGMTEEEIAKITYENAEKLFFKN